jgi:hypothetical protein
MHFNLFLRWSNGRDCWNSRRHHFNTTIPFDGNDYRGSLRDKPIYCVDIHNISNMSILVYWCRKYTLCSLNWRVLINRIIFRPQVHKENYLDHEKKVVYKLRTLFRTILFYGNLAVEIHSELNYLSK